MAQPPKSEDTSSDTTTEETSPSSSTPAQAESAEAGSPSVEAAPSPAAAAEDAAAEDVAAEHAAAENAADAAPSSDEGAIESSPAPIEDAVHPDAPDAASLPSTFEEMGLSEPMRTALEKLGWGAPTKVQAAAFGPVTAGRDVLVQSQTGSGKTGAFCLPWLAERFESGDAKETGVQLLVMTPTRELAKQVCDQLIKLAGETPCIPLPVYGGTAIGPQFDALKAGVHAVVGTPGRILDHIRRRTLDLSRVQTVVLDEADEMLSMGFLEDIHAILDACPRERQTTLFSATVPSDIERIARRYMNAPESLKLSGDDIAAAQIEHVYYSVPGTMRPRDLINIVALEEPGSTLIFCNTREETNLVANVLRREGFSAEALSSDLSQAAREHVLGAMRKGRLRFLVATDVASRGIDISHISHVFNYSFPQNAESYVHRTGRTGRAGRAGKAISLIGPHDMGNFYHLKLAYPSIEFGEAQFPPREEVEARRKETKLDQVSKRFPELVSPEWTLLARTLSADPRGEQVIAYLLSEAMSNPDPSMQVARDLPDEDEEFHGRGRRGRRERDRDGDRRDGDRRDGDRRDRDRGRRGRRDRDGDRARDRDRDRDHEHAAEGREGEEPRRRRRRRRRDEDEPRREDVEATAAESTDDAPVAEASDAEAREAVESDGEEASADISTEAAAEGDEERGGRRRRRRRRRRRGAGAEDGGESTDGEQSRAADEAPESRGPAEPAPLPELAAAATEVEGDALVVEAVAEVASTPSEDTSSAPSADGEAPEATDADAPERDAEATEDAETAADEAAEEPALVAAPCESTEGFTETHDGVSARGRRRRRRRRRRGGRGKGEGESAADEAVATSDASGEESDTEAVSADAESPDGEGSGGKRRRRRRRGGRGKKAEAVEQHVSQDQIIIDIDESELEVVRGEFGEIDELDDLTLKGRRRGVIDALQDEVELEDMSEEDTPAEAEDDATDDDTAEDDANDDTSDDGVDEADGESTDEDAAESDEAVDAKEEKKRKRRRRRRKKKKAEAPPPELTAPPHKDFWEVWSAKFTYKEFEDETFRGGTEAIEDEPEPEPTPKRKRRSRGSKSTEDDRGRDRDRDPAKIGVEDGPMVTVALNVGRSHGKKSAHIRELLASDFGLEGRSVRNLTVKETLTEFRVSTSAYDGLQAAVLGYVFDDIELELTVVEPAPVVETEPVEATEAPADAEAPAADGSEEAEVPAEVLAAAEGDPEPPQPEV